MTINGIIEKKLRLLDLNKISNELDDLLLPYFFDLSIYNHIKNADLIAHPPG